MGKLVMQGAFHRNLSQRGLEQIQPTFWHSQRCNCASEGQKWAKNIRSMNISALPTQKVFSHRKSILHKNSINTICEIQCEIKHKNSFMAIRFLHFSIVHEHEQRIKLNCKLVQLFSQSLLKLNGRKQQISKIRAECHSDGG